MDYDIEVFFDLVNEPGEPFSGVSLTILDSGLAHEFVDLGSSFWDCFAVSSRNLEKWVELTTPGEQMLAEFNYSDQLQELMGTLSKKSIESYTQGTGAYFPGVVDHHTVIGLN